MFYMSQDLFLTLVLSYFLEVIVCFFPGFFFLIPYYFYFKHLFWWFLFPASFKVPHPSPFFSSSLLLGLFCILHRLLELTLLWPWVRAAGRPWLCWAVSLQSVAWGCWEWQWAPTTGCTWRRESLCLWTRALTSRPHCTLASGESAFWLVSDKILKIKEICGYGYLCAPEICQLVMDESKV